MRNLFALIISFSFLITPLAALDMTWLGGSGKWLDPTMWSTGTVPTINDRITINSGSVNITGNAFAQCVMAYEPSEIHIDAGVTVTIIASGCSGMICHGLLEVSGTLDITDGTGMTTGDLNVYAGGLVRLRNCASGLTNLGDIYNEGTIDLGPGMFNSLYLYPFATLTNSVQGVIQIGGGNNAAIRANAASITNHGAILISDCVTAMFLFVSDITNSSSGYIGIEGAEYGINSFANSNIVNAGKMEIETLRAGLLDDNYAPGNTFNNTSTGKISVSSTLGPAISIFNTISEFDNFGIISATVNSGYSLSLFNMYGQITNHACARFTLSGRIENFSTGSVINKGWMYVTANGQSINNGTFTNTGVLQDNYGVLTGIINNNRLIARTAQGPLVANVPVPNFLVVNSGSGHTSQGVFINSAATISAGSYNPNTNVYVPNAAGAGRNWIYIKIRNNANSCSSVFRVRILPPPPTPIAPPNDPTELVAANTSQMNAAARLYPNPSGGAFQLEIPEALPGDCDILIFNTLGQLVHQQQNDFSASPSLSVNAAEKWPPGVYSVKISQNGQPIWQSRLALTR